MYRLLHTSDLHLGKRFGQMPEELRGRLTEARHGSIARLVAAARSHGAEAILVAGDVFDTGTPSPATLRQALQAMAADPTVRWVLMPGNHDSLSADQLWSEAARDLPENVILALTSEPITLSPSLVVLPAPAPTRRPGRDLTEWMAEAEVPAEAIRVGLAHGGVRDFGEEGTSDIIPPDRAEQARLDFLALGDWHGQTRINDRTWYSGTPEPDRFKHNAPGSALVVSIETSGALPVVTPAETGKFRWLTLNLSLIPGDDPVAHLNSALPEMAQRRETILRVEFEGRVRLPERTNILTVLNEAAPDFAWVETRDENLRLEHDIKDLDTIDQAGVLRQAAEALFEESQESDEASIAQAALSRLYGYAVDDS